MKYALLTSLLVLTGASGTLAQDRVYRCGNNEYTNDQAVAKTRNCKQIEGNVSVIAGTAVRSPAPSAPVATGSAAQKVDVNDQRARDSDARGVLEAELKRAEARRAELLAEYKDGKPDHQGIESRNHQRYLDREHDRGAGRVRPRQRPPGRRRLRRPRPHLGQNSLLDPADPQPVPVSRL